MKKAIILTLVIWLSVLTLRSSVYITRIFKEFNQDEEVKLFTFEACSPVTDGDDLLTRRILSYLNIVEICKNP